MNGDLLQRLPHAIRTAHSNGGDAIGQVARELAMDADAVGAQIADHLQWPWLSGAALDALSATNDVVLLIEAFLRQTFVGLDAEGRTLAVLVNPWNDDTLAWLERRLGQRPLLALSAAENIAHRLQRERARLGQSGALPLAPVAPLVDTSSAIGVVDGILQAAWKDEASDVHFETLRAGLQVKHRVDGLLVDTEQVSDAQLAQEIISRIKVLAQLDIAEKRVPQDGRFSAQLGDRIVDCRVSVMPSAFGEDAVIRLLDKRHLSSGGGRLTLATLGFDGARLDELRGLARRPHGMLLVTGPTGSGKTTTLYGVLTEIRTGAEKIVTIEDPIEYELAGVLQVPVNEKKSLTFARGLRSILRHDPDVIMVGEIRDRETAEIAIQSALTGHLVFTTVHANTVLDVVSRFAHMGVDLYGFVSCLNGVVAQRLVRLNCSHCAIADETDGARVLARRGGTERALVLKRGKGCEHCHGTGYRGRTAVAEVLTIDDRLRDLIAQRAPIETIKHHVYGDCRRGLGDAALDLVCPGRTTLDEVQRVVDLA